MNGSRNRFWIAALAILVITLAGGAWWPGRTNPHLKSLVSYDPITGYHDDEIRRGELEAAGPDVVPFLREQLRREPGLATQGLTWLNSSGVVAWIHDWVSESMANSIWSRLGSQNMTRVQAARSLLLLGPAAAAARPELTMRATGVGSPLSWTATAALASLTPEDPSAVSNYLARLAGNNQSERFFLVRDFPLIWPKAPPHLHALMERLQDADSGVRNGAVKSLAHYGAAAAGAVPRLQEMLIDSDRKGHSTAAYALGIISSNHADLAVAVMLEQQRTNNAWTGDLAHQLYAALGPAARRAEPALRRELSRSATNGFSGPPAFALWRVTGEASPEIIAGLMRGCTQGVQRFQVMSLKGLREIGPPASNAVPALRQLRSSPHWTIQRLAEDALNRIHSNETRISRTPTD
jgi:HEAT repeat protein